jgi:predicted nucleic acid-binding protein
MSSLIVDASVLAKVFADEKDSSLARAELETAREIVCPDLAMAEAYMALWKKWRRKQFLDEQLKEAPRLLQLLVTRSVPLSLLFGRAAELARLFNHPIYDCFYLALAEQERAPLVTADARLMAAAGEMRGVEVRTLGTACNPD